MFFFLIGPYQYQFLTLYHSQTLLRLSVYVLKVEALLQEK